MVVGRGHPVMGGTYLGVDDMDEDEAREIAAELTRLAQEMGFIP